MKSKHVISKLTLLILGGLMIGFIGAMLFTQIDYRTTLSALWEKLLHLLQYHLLLIQFSSTLLFALIAIAFYMIANKTIRKFGYSALEEYRAHSYLSLGISLSSLSIIINFTLFKVITYYPIRLNSSENNFLKSLAIFIFLFMLNFTCEMIGIVLLYKSSPSQKGSSLGIRIKTLILINVIFTIAFSLILILSFLFNIGILPFVVLFILWSACSISYFYYCYRVGSGLMNY